MSEQTQNSQEHTQERSLNRTLLAGLLGAAIGAILCAIVLIAAMPSLMIRTHESTLDFDQTVSAIETAVKAAEWQISGVVDMNKSMSKHGVEFGPRVKLIKLCKPEYAKSVLTTDRNVSTMMPCTLSVWEDDEGKVHVSKLNTALMGKMFGGNVADVMGGKVSVDEARILRDIVKN